MSRHESYLDHLSSVPLFAGCSKKELTKIARAGDEVTVEAGHVLTRQGDAGREAFVIVDGTATVRRGDRKVATVGPGDTVGELALLDHGPRTATVTAAEDTKVLVIGAREFAALIDDVPPIAHKLLKSLAARIRELDKKTYG